MHMTKKIKDLSWSEIIAFLSKTNNVVSPQYYVCRLISAFTRHNKTNWPATYKEAFLYVNQDMLELEINVETWRIVNQ